MVDELKIFTDIEYIPFFGDYIYNQLLKPTLELKWVIAVIGCSWYSCNL